ncbi:MAG: hypothetical protein ACI857_001420 [Arenicella sp.]|jgi:hypothetical protein
MPFTFSHPFIILPLLKLSKNRISATALFAGSMAPDFEYFINFQMKQIHGHTTSGMFYYDFPLAILLCFAFHSLVRDALIHYSPRFIKNRWCHYIGYDWKERWKNNWKMIMVSAMIGVFSHIFLDSFTHPHRLMTDNIEFLRHSISFFGTEMKIYDIGQTWGSVFGLGAILYVIVREPEKQQFRSGFRTKMIFWSMAVSISLVILTLRNVGHAGDFVATSIAGGLIGLMVAPAIMKTLKIEEEQEILY